MIGIVASVIAAIAAIAALWFSVRTSKGNILRRIDKIEAQIQRIDDRQIRMYGLNGHPKGIVTALDIKREKLQSEVAKLKRKL